MSAPTPPQLREDQLCGDPHPIEVQLSDATHAAVSGVLEASLADSSLPATQDTVDAALLGVIVGLRAAVRQLHLQGELPGHPELTA